MDKIYDWFCVVVGFRHAWAPFFTGWGSITHKSFSGRGRGRKKRHKTTGASTGHADDHYLTPLSTSVTNFFPCHCYMHAYASQFIFIYIINHSSADLFNITNMRGKVAKFCIFKTLYRLGEDIIGTFTFSEGDIPCLQVQITLKCLLRLLFLSNYKRERTLYCSEIISNHK